MLDAGRRRTFGRVGSACGADAERLKGPLRIGLWRPLIVKDGFVQYATSAATRSRGTRSPWTASDPPFSKQRTPGALILGPDLESRTGTPKTDQTETDIELKGS